MRDRGRAGVRRTARHHPGVRPGRHPAGRAGDVDGPAGGCPGSPERTPGRPPTRPTGPEAAGRGGHRGAQPRGSAVHVERFVAAARSLGLNIPVVAAVAVFTDARSAAVLTALPGLEIDPAAVEAVITATDPVAAGIEMAVAEARALLSIDGVAGVNLSGMASARGRRTPPRSRPRSATGSARRPGGDRGHVGRVRHGRGVDLRGRAGPRAGVLPAGRVPRERKPRRPAWLLEHLDPTARDADAGLRRRCRRSSRVRRPRSASPPCCRSPSPEPVAPPAGCSGYPWCRPGPTCRSLRMRSKWSGASACCARSPIRARSWPSCAACSRRTASSGYWFSWPRPARCRTSRRATTSRPKTSCGHSSRAAGFTVINSAANADFAEAPAHWREHADAVESELERRHHETGLADRRPAVQRSSGSCSATATSGVC